MSGYAIEITYEQVRAIIAKELKWCLEQMQPEKRLSLGIWFTDEEKDLKEMKKMRKALIRVLTYYTTKDERDWKDET